MLLLAFTSALRRSELAALDVADLESDPAGTIVHVARSKTDQDSKGAYVGIPYASRPRLCAVLAVAARRDRLGSLGASRHGPGASLSGAAIRDALIRRATAAGLSPAHGERFYTAHSTRSGFATQAAANGASERAIMDQGRWRSLQVARSYIRRGSVFNHNAADRLGL